VYAKGSPYRGEKFQKGKERTPGKGKSGSKSEVKNKRAENKKEKIH
jgi:hypothetical protein